MCRRWEGEGEAGNKPACSKRTGTNRTEALSRMRPLTECLEGVCAYSCPEQTTRIT